MTEFKIDVSDEKWAKTDTAGPGFLWPDGQYVVFISDARTYVAKTGTEAVEITFQCHDPRSPQNGKDLRYQRFWLSDGSLPRLIQLCKAAGQTGSFNARDDESLANALNDRALRITVRTRKDTYNGETRDKQEAGQFRPLSAEDRRVLRDAYGETELPPLEDEPENFIASPDGEGFDDSDIPF